MAADAGTTAFVTGAAGFIGLELIKLLVARGYQVSGLAQCPEAAQRVRHAGAVPVIGDLLEPGQWQDEAAADWVFHLPPHRESGPCVTGMSAASMARERVVMDAHLLDAVAAGATRRIVVGRVLADDLHADAVFSNIRLRGTGFRFEYPTVDLGLHQILGALHA